MKINRALGIGLGLVVIGAAPMAFADNVIVGSQPTSPPAPVAASPTTPAAVVVQPTQPAAAQPVVVDDPAHRTVVHTDVTPTHSYMGTIFGSAFMGGAAGALIGGAIYFLGNQTHPYNIAYWAAGGVLVGTGVGIAQIMVQESRVSQATAMAADPAPTLRLALYQTRF
jgi:hypothetical protein